MLWSRYRCHKGRYKRIGFLRFLIFFRLGRGEIYNFSRVTTIGQHHEFVSYLNVSFSQFLLLNVNIGKKKEYVFSLSLKGMSFIWALFIIKTIGYVPSLDYTHPMETKISRSLSCSSYLYVLYITYWRWYLAFLWENIFIVYEGT